MFDTSEILHRLFGDVPPDAAGIMARTLWGEARGEGRIGMQAVAGCILNRAAHPRWWGNDALSVCVAPWQFSCWNANDPNLPKMLAVTEADPEFAVALDLARVALQGGLQDITEGADSYYDIRMSAAPSWAERAAPTVVIGHHRFMRVELPTPTGQPAAPCLSVHSTQAAATRPPAPPEPTADDLNAAELARIQHES